MASNSLKNNNEDGSDRNPRPFTTFVQADPSNFRAVVEKLTGPTTIKQTHKQPISTPSGHVRNLTFSEAGQRKSGHQLHERRKAGRKLEIDILNKVATRPAVKDTGLIIGYDGGEVVTPSPVSTLDDFCGNRSPGTPILEEIIEEKAIAEKGFYLHPSPIGRSEPELLVLFPLHSPN